MIYIDKRKLTVDGVDVYPDHESPTQFWYIPGAIQLAQRHARKVLSYLWYTESQSDSSGTGFLNFEVNTAVPPATLDRIRSKIASTWGADAGKLSLSTVPYHTGSVSFSVLGPIAAQAANLSNDPSVLHQSTEQLVWNAGSSSLVGDNAAVCSVKFTKEGKLAAAMKAALQSKSQNITALYRLEFLGMRPSVTFKVKGTFEKTIRDFKVSLGTQLPLEAFVLDLGIQAQWQKIMQNTDLEIEVENYSGDDAQEGLKWAQQVLLDYILKNFFEVQLGSDPNAWTPLSEAPKVEEAVQRAKEVEQAATDQVSQKQSGADEDPDSEKKDSAVKELVKAATSFIPKVNIRAAYYQGRQVNSIDFLYSEKKAKSLPVLPQAVIGLASSDNPGDYITQVNRSQDPFGLPYNVVVSVPEDVDRAKIGLQTLNVQARYPAGVPPINQMVYNLTVSAGKVSGDNPLPFQYDVKGTARVEYSADFVFKPGDDWHSDTLSYSLTGASETGLISAMAESIVEFLTINIDLSQNFLWDNADQAVVRLTSAKWQGEKRVLLQKGKEAPQILRIRSDAKFRAEPIHYSVDLRKANTSVHTYGPLPVIDKQITVVDRFASHIPVYFTAAFDTASLDITLTYEDGDFLWEDSFILEAGQKKVQRIIPSLKDFRRAKELKAHYEVTDSSGKSFKGAIEGAETKIIKAPV